MRISGSEADSERLQNQDLWRRTSRGAERLLGGGRGATSGLAVDGVTDKDPSQLSCGLHHSWRFTTSQLRPELTRSSRHHVGYVLHIMAAYSKWVNTVGRRAFVSELVTKHVIHYLLVSVCLSVCLWAGLIKKLWTIFHNIFKGVGLGTKID